MSTDWRYSTENELNNRRSAIKSQHRSNVYANRNDSIFMIPLRNELIASETNRLCAHNHLDERCRFVLIARSNVAIPRTGQFNATAYAVAIQ